MASPTTAALEDHDLKSVGTSASSGTKRKRDAAPKFYAVRTGFEPGIYHSWPDCMAQIKGYKGAAFKSFTSLTDAEAFIANKSSAGAPSAASSATPTKFYAVRNGRRPGIYTSWSDAQAQITGWTKPRHRSFATRAEAEAFIRSGSEDGEAVSTATASATQPEKPVENSKKPLSKKESTKPAAKKQKTIGGGVVALDGGPLDAALADLPPGAEDDFDPRIIMNPNTGKIEWKDQKTAHATKVVPKALQPGTMINIYTDGSSLANGQKGAVAGVGVYFGPGDPKNVSEPLAGARQTNQRAELTAIQRALDIAPIDHPVTIYSDSNYAINCATTWCKTWRSNGWMTSTRKPVENKDLVEQIVNRIDDRTAAGTATEFKWLKGHADDPGNVAADALAVNGAKEARDIRRAEGANGS